jgi:hypothetical protein
LKEGVERSETPFHSFFFSLCVNPISVSETISTPGCCCFVKNSPMAMKHILGIAALLLAETVATAQNAAPGRANVDKLCGCFDVEFKYAETFSPDKNYKFHDREEISGGTELILPVEVSDN